MPLLSPFYGLNRINVFMELQHRCPGRSADRWTDEQADGQMGGHNPNETFFLRSIIIFMVICVKFHHDRTST